MALRHPLYVSGASGGVTSPQDARLALAAFLTGPGIMNGFTVTGSTSGPNMQYTIAAGVAVTQRGTLAADGLYVVPNDGPVTVDSGAPAPASGTRWDLIWVRCLNAFDGGFGDANSDPIFDVTVGTAGSTPTKPYASVPQGALVLAEANVGTNIANASLATISMVAEAVTIGGDTGWVNVPLASGYTTSGGLTPQYRVKNGIVYFRGQVQPSSGTFSTSTVAISSPLPSAYWPGGSGYAMATAVTSSSAIQARLYVPASSGILTVGFSATGASYVDLSALSYPLG